jgi:hypothetical protein
MNELFSNLHLIDDKLCEQFDDKTQQVIGDKPS